MKNPKRLWLISELAVILWLLWMWARLPGVRQAPLALFVLFPVLSLVGNFVKNPKRLWPVSASATIAWLTWMWAGLPGMWQSPFAIPFVVFTVFALLGIFITWRGESIIAGREGLRAKSEPGGATQ